MFKAIDHLMIPYSRLELNSLPLKSEVTEDLTPHIEKQHAGDYLQNGCDSRVIYKVFSIQLKRWLEKELV